MLFVNRPWGYGSVGRAMRSQRIGHEFESRYLHQKKKHKISCVSFFVKILLISIPTKRLAFGKRLRFYALCSAYNFQTNYFVHFLFLFLLAPGVIYCTFCAIDNYFSVTINRTFVIYIGHIVAVLFFCIVNIIIYFNGNPCIIVFFCV